MGIDITAYDCWKPCQVWPDPKGEGITLFQDLNYFCWLHITEASLADFSHLHSVSREIRRDAGGVEDKRECLAILL